jgi:co-chaperonin GroES (HSP10)
MADETQCVAEPQLGFLIVRRKAPDKTAGGVAIPETLQEQAARFFVIRSSKGYMDHGQLVLSTLLPGDEVVLSAEGVETTRFKDGREVRKGLIRSVAFPPGLLPEDYYIVLLRDVVSRIAREHVQPVLSKPQLTIVESKPRVH